MKSVSSTVNTNSEQGVWRNRINWLNSKRIEFISSNYSKKFLSINLYTTSASAYEGLTSMEIALPP